MVDAIFTNAVLMAASRRWFESHDVVLCRAIHVAHVARGSLQVPGGMHRGGS